MSLHALTEDTAWHDDPLAAESAPERSYEGRAICSCGHVGEWRGGSTLAMHERLRIDYRDHVEEALGPNAYYLASVACRNCGVAQEQPILVGTHVYQAACARCGTRMLNPDNDAWDQSKEESRRWSW